MKSILISQEPSFIMEEFLFYIKVLVTEYMSENLFNFSSPVFDLFSYIRGKCSEY